MASPTRFTRARKVDITVGSVHEHEYTVPDGKEFKVFSLFCSATENVTVELLYTDDGGSTWTNPWDSGSNHLLWLLLAAGIPASSKVDYTWFTGNSTNIRIKIKITNTSATNTATAFYLVKALEREVV